MQPDGDGGRLPGGWRGWRACPKLQVQQQLMRAHARWCCSSPPGPRRRARQLGGPRGGGGRRGGGLGARDLHGQVSRVLLGIVRRLQARGSRASVLAVLPLCTCLRAHRGGIPSHPPRTPPPLPACLPLTACSRWRRLWLRASWAALRARARWEQRNTRGATRAGHSQHPVHPCARPRSPAPTTERKRTPHAHTPAAHRSLKKSTWPRSPILWRPSLRQWRGT